MRAAANSIARGSPSRRMQMSATMRAFSSVSAKSGVRARALNKERHSRRLHNQATLRQRIGRRKRQRGDRPQMFPTQVEGLAAGHDNLQRGAPGEQVDDECGGAHLLEVVEYEQEVLRLQGES